MAVVLPLTVLTLASGSSSVARLGQAAKAGRWAALALLAALALAQFVALGRHSLQLPLGWALASLFLVVAVESALWSVDAKLTVERGVTVGVVFGTAAALALGAPDVDVAAARILGGIVLGAGLVAVASLVVLVVAHGDAVLAATAGAGWRFQGLGENPNTVPMLLCVAAPVALWWTLTRTRGAQLAGVALLVLFVGEMAVSGSRGSLVAGVGGTLVTALACLRTWRARVVAVLAIAAIAVGCIEVAKLPKAVPIAAAAPTPSAAPPVKTKGIDAQTVFRQEDEIGFPLNGAYVAPPPRTIFGSSGRAQSWNGALQQGKQRPLLGYGFGTEEQVFVDRFFSFESRLVENGYLGLFLQLGAVGLALFVALLLALLASGVRAVRAQPRSVAAAASGVLVAAMLVEVGQSGFLAVGNIASAAIWLAVLPLALLAQERA
ncbi:MAG: hypothetical protein ACYDA3_12650 [Gaiellaceae bacterium]